MEMKYYNPSNNFRAPIPREPKPYVPTPKKASEIVVPKQPESCEEHENLAAVEEPCFSLESKKVDALSPNHDDLLLLGLILVLLANKCDDYILLIILGYLLITGKLEA